ncbi:hypothetical protein IFO70_07010 [Phormidium tenue FACHB-886]|nr:hypothetical protein [Phormidium tenue FACHB-886]
MAHWLCSARLAPLAFSLGLAANSLSASPTFASPTIPEATAAARVDQRQQQVRQVRPESYDVARYPIANWDHWRNMLWVTALVEPRETYVTEAVARLISMQHSDLSSSEKRTLDMAMTIANQLYLSDSAFYASLRPPLEQTLAQSSDSYWVGIALSTLTQVGSTAEQRITWRNQVIQRFPNWQNDVYLYSTLRDVGAIDQPTELPPLRDLLQWSIAPNEPQLYVFCRPDRGVLCQTVLKDANGEFVRQEGTLWSIPLVLRSLHNLPWIFTRGQSPQGIYRIEGTVPQPDTEYFRPFGLFSLVNLYIPFESGVQAFVPGRASQLTSLPSYQSLLPPSWRNYFPIQQTYWAGKAGRSEFRIHGTGESPGLFTSNSRYTQTAGWNPSIGCLSALELYDENGQLQQADMPKILEALTAASRAELTGYLIVVDVPGDDTPVSLAEIESALQ